MAMMAALPSEARLFCYPRPALPDAKTQEARRPWSARSLAPRKLFYAVRTHAAHRDTGMLYLIVDFWLSKAGHDAGNPAAASNDFLMQLSLQDSTVVTNGTGQWQRTDGVFVTPPASRDDLVIGFNFTTTNRTRAAVLADVRANILAYWQTAKAAALANKPFPRDHTDRTIPTVAASGPASTLLGDLTGQTQDVAGQ